MAYALPGPHVALQDLAAELAFEIWRSRDCASRELQCEALATLYAARGMDAEAARWFLLAAGQAAQLGRAREAAGYARRGAALQPQAPTRPNRSLSGPRKARPLLPRDRH
jgi:hypothetical protein